MPSKKYIVTGASGLVGWNLCRRLLARGACEVAAIRRSAPVPDGVHPIELDLADSRAVAQFARACDADVVFHCAAIRDPAACAKDPNASRLVNVESVKQLAQNLDPKRTMLVFTSTDLVFNGRKAPYVETDATDPIMLYGEQKNEAERFVQSYPGMWAIARVTLCYGAGPQAHPSFLGWLEAGLRGDGLTLFSDEYRTAVYVKDLCAVLEAIALRRATGVFHTGGPERLSRAEFGIIFARVFGLDAGKIRGKTLAEANLAAVRPADVSLDIGKARRELDYHPLDTEAALRDMIS